MGGKAFCSGPTPLNIVRLPHAQYIILCSHYQKLLLKYYRQAVVPPPAPEKIDHGDIDVLVTEPLRQVLREELAQALDARNHMSGGAHANSFAIRVPDTDDESDGERYLQLDVRISWKERFEWEKTIYSYGDLWHIIGSAATRFSLMINDAGLHIRLAGVEDKYQKDCVLFLTRDPSDIMAFLGLDQGAFRKGFDTLDEIFGWAVGSRIFRRNVFEKEIISEKQQRIRNKRPMYAKFVTKWLPTHPAAGVVQGDAEANPESILDEALEKFEKGEDYAEMFERYRKRVMKDTMWKMIVRVLPLEGKELGQAVVALKTSMRWSNGQLKIAGQDEMEVERVPALDEETVKSIVIPWVGEHWREAMNLVKR